MSSPPSSSDAHGGRTGFHRLHPSLQRWIWEQRWTELRRVQEQAIPPILDAKRDVILMAATAGGKTEAAFLPILTRVLEAPANSVQVLCVSPLKALINDQYERLSELGERIGVPIHRWHGDVSSSDKQRLTKHPSGVLLITPESLEAMFVLRGPEVRRLFSSLSYVVVDELHSFIGSERGCQLVSLLHRTELAIRQRVPRIALSATLGDMAMAAEYLRPGAGADVVIVAPGEDDATEIKLLVKGYERTTPAAVGPDEPDDQDSDDLRAIAADLFRVLRGSNNLVFANSRVDVELYSDRLRRLAEQARLPQEFWPHHGSLSKEIRQDAERVLKDRNRPATLVCTTTLEMGIDVGQIQSVAQIGPPWGVASLRQRLGRSGRRGEAAILRAYVSEEELSDTSSPLSAIRSRLFQTIATITLLIEGWFEPPTTGKLHFSTLLHQVLSALAQFGGARPLDLWRGLCHGPFAPVEQATFSRLLRCMGAADLIQQTHDGTLVLAPTGENLVNHYSFFAVFDVPEEYRLVWGPRTLGTLPVTFPVHVDLHLIFAGRRWRVVSVDDSQKVIELVPSPGGRLPQFQSSGGVLHARIRERMLALYLGTDLPAFLDSRAAILLAEGRTNFRRLGLDETTILPTAGAQLFCWTGDKVINTLQLALASQGHTVSRFGLVLALDHLSPDRLAAALTTLANNDAPTATSLADLAKNKVLHKYDGYLDDTLLTASYASSELDVPAAWEHLRALIDAGFFPVRADDPAQGP